jgi:hypothetical protein
VLEQHRVDPQQERGIDVDLDGCIPERALESRQRGADELVGRDPVARRLQAGLEPREL